MTSPSLRPQRPGWPVLSAVAVGGAVGALLRWWLAGLAPADGSPVAGWFALGLVNVSGSFLLGVLTGLAAHRPLPRWLVSGLGFGVLGSYTSLSAVVLAASLALSPALSGFIQSGTPGGGVLLVGMAGTVVALAAGAALGTAAAAAGLLAGGWRPPHQERSGP